jgi:hypothetical protein
MQGCAYPVSSLWTDVLRTCCTYGDGEWVLFPYLTTSHSLYLCSTSTGLLVHASSHTTLHTLPSLSLSFSCLLSSPLLAQLSSALYRLRLRQAGSQSVSLSSFPFLLSPDDSLTPTPPVWHEGALEVKAAVYCSSSAQRCSDRNNHEIACLTCVYAARGTSLSTLTALS